MNWTTKESDAVKRLVSIVASSDSGPAGDAARATGALPVHCDMGGCLLLGHDGSVRRLDFESGSVVLEPLQKWVLLARVKAARKFPELVHLMPHRPEGAELCPSCNGTGIILGHLDCATCSSLGFVDNE